MEQYFKQSPAVLGNLEINKLNKNVRNHNNTYQKKTENSREVNNENRTVFNPAFNLNIKAGTGTTENGGNLGKKNQNQNDKQKKGKPQQIWKRMDKKNLIPMFIGGLGPEVTEENLKEVFGEFPSLHSVKICADSSTHVSLGYGYLNFTNKQEVEKCVEKYNYTVVFGNEIKIMPSVRNSVYRKNIGTNVFFSNLPLENPALTTRVFYDTFKVYGKILSCKLDNRKNIGFVYFEDDKAATSVIGDYNNKEYFGATVVCGLHFDKELRNYPDFDKSKLNLNKNVILEDELLLSGSLPDTNEKDAATRQLVHPNAIFIKNLPKQTTEDELMEYFCTMGPVKSVFTSGGNKNQSSKWAFITYKKQEDAKKAITQLNNTNFKGNNIGVSKAKPRKTQEDRCHDQFCLIITDLSSICTGEFMTKLLSQEHLHYEKFVITSYNNGLATFCGLMSVKSKIMQTKVVRFLNEKLIGGSVVHATLPESEVELFHIQNRLGCFSGDSDNFVENAKLLHPNMNSLINFPRAYSEATSIDTRNEGFQDFNSKVCDTFLANQLKAHIRKTINFNQLDANNFDDNALNGISDYILEVFWNGDECDLSVFIANIGRSVKYEQLFNMRVTEALERLGYTCGVA